MGRAGPVKLATGVKVKVPLEEGCCGWVGPRTVSPGAIAEAPIGLIKNANINIKHQRQIVVHALA